MSSKKWEIDNEYTNVKRIKNFDEKDALYCYITEYFGIEGNILAKKVKIKNKYMFTQNGKVWKVWYCDKDFHEAKCKNGEGKISKLNLRIITDLENWSF